MATISPELVTQRTAKAGVSIQAGPEDNAAGEVMWASTTTLPTTVVTNTSVAGNQSDREVVGDRVDAAAPFEATVV